MQYPVLSDGFDANVERADALIRTLEADGRHAGLLVLPAFSFTGCPETGEQAAAMAEVALGRSVQVASDFATRTGRHVVCSHIERESEQLFHRCVIIEPGGTVVGAYRQTHLDPSMDWATPGEDLPVFDTAIGRIGMLTGEDARFPEASGVLAVRRADLIAVPSRWHGTYGGWLHDAAGLFAHRYPTNTMAHWYAIAKTSQAYTVVANSVGEGCQGSSGIFTIDPVDSDEPPVVGSIDGTEVVSMQFRTLAEPTSWMSQERLVGGRRADLAVPVVLDPASPEFAQWRNSSGYDMGSWSAYRQ